MSILSEHEGEQIRIILVIALTIIVLFFLMGVDKAMDEKDQATQADRERIMNQYHPLPNR